MKKLITACLCLLLTLAVTAAGFLLPSAMSAYQDRQTFSKIEHMSMEPLELTYSSSLYDTLRLLSKGHYMSITRSQAAAAAPMKYMKLYWTSSASLKITAFSCQIRSLPLQTIRLPCSLRLHPTAIFTQNSTALQTESFPAANPPAARKHPGILLPILQLPWSGRVLFILSQATG